MHTMPSNPNRWRNIPSHRTTVEPEGNRLQLGPDGHPVVRHDLRAAGSDHGHEWFEVVLQVVAGVDLLSAVRECPALSSSDMRDSKSSARCSGDSTGSKYGWVAGIKQPLFLDNPRTALLA
ncbi:MAG TPA: hypothetical protein VF086_20320 [Propionibacteriaceae bacterium]